MNFRSTLLAVGIVGSLVGTNAANAAGWYTGTIDQVEVTATGEVMAFLQASANHECGSKRVDYIAPTDATHSKNFLAALLSWQAQGRSVRVYIASCDGTAGLINAAINEP